MLQTAPGFQQPPQNPAKVIKTARQSDALISKSSSHLHHGDCGINLWRQGDMDLVLVSVHPERKHKDLF